VADPVFSLVAFNSAEFAEVKNHLNDAPFSPEGSEQTLNIEKVLPIMLMEYVVGDVLMGLTHPEYLEDKKCAFEIGQLLAFDLLINNYDRLPLVWTNTGNSGNILFSAYLPFFFPSFFSQALII